MRIIITNLSYASGCSIVTTNFQIENVENTMIVPTTYGTNAFFISAFSSAAPVMNCIPNIVPHNTSTIIATANNTL